MTYKKIGFIIADDDEFVPVKQLCERYLGKTYDEYGKTYCSFSIDEVDFLAVHCGIGKVNAAAATAALIAFHKPDCIINFGLSGAVHGVYKNEIVLGKSFTEYDFDLSPIGYKIGVKPQETYVYEPDCELNRLIMKVDSSIVPAVFVTGDRFVTDTALRNLLISDFNANCCDMETAAIASVCHDFDLPFASIRYLSDSADDDAGASYRAVNELKEDTLLNIVIKSITNV